MELVSVFYGYPGALSMQLLPEYMDILMATSMDIWPALLGYSIGIMMDFHRACSKALVPVL